MASAVPVTAQMVCLLFFLPFFAFFLFLSSWALKMNDIFFFFFISFFPIFLFLRFPVSYIVFVSSIFSVFSYVFLVCSFSVFPETLSVFFFVFSVPYRYHFNLFCFLCSSAICASFLGLLAPFPCFQGLFPVFISLSLPEVFSLLKKQIWF